MQQKQKLYMLFSFVYMGLELLPGSGCRYCSGAVMEPEVPFGGSQVGLILKPIFTIISHQS